MLIANNNYPQKSPQFYNLLFYMKLF